MRPLGPDAVVVRALGVPDTVVRGRRMLLVGEDQLLALDEVGERVWLLAEQPVRVAEVVEVLARAHGVAEATVREDVVAFLQDLIARGALSRG